jgi:hypothetical protein
VAVEKADDLYGVPIEQFVPERGALARVLRERGERDEATRVGKLRKPSVAAWAVNQLVRTQRKAVGELFDAGDATQKAQTELLAGHGDAGALRDAARRERAAVESLLEAARGLLSASGHDLSATTLERVADTLNAAALDREARDQVSAGRLERELRHVGMGPGGPAMPERPARPPAKRQEEKKAVQRATRVAEGEARRAKARTARALEIARERRDRAAQALEEADAALAEARAAAKAAEEEHRRASGS